MAAADLEKLSNEINGDFSASSEGRRMNTAISLIMKALMEQNSKTAAIEAKQEEMCGRIEKLVENVKSLECRLTSYQHGEHGAVGKPAASKKVAKDAVATGTEISPSVKNLRQTVEHQQEMLTRIMSGSVLVVDASGAGFFTSVPPALEVARSGDTIVLRPGTYTDPLMLLTPDVTIQGADKSTVFIQSPEPDDSDKSNPGSMLMFYCSCTVQNVTIAATQPQCCAVRFEKGNGVLADCVVTSSNLSCVVVSAGNSPQIINCDIHGSSHHGIICKSKSSPLVKNNIIHGNKQPNIAIDKEATPIIDGNRIYESSQNGVWFRANAMGKLINNDIYNNAYSNIDINAGSEPTIQSNRIHRSQKCGICVAEGAGGDIHLNEVFDNAYSNIGVMAKSYPTIRKNTIHASKQHGILVKSGAAGTILDNDFYNNTLANIKVEQGATTSVSNSR
eukprot:TRINITY_DN16035_c0_g1_i1.p1 TRINITY_DN16035_c0_g1~~TRINITY_DN16035_c0_g1_i1.p1  ORF type:complete len:469 (+),score=87.71 TRINITY_DN16035_c0_g1_i1:68-1408(+)